MQSLITIHWIHQKLEQNMFQKLPPPPRYMEKNKFS